MFLEELTDENIIEFTKQFNCEIETIIRYQNSVLIKFTDKRSLSLRDFDLNLFGDFNTTSEKAEKLWHKYMQNIFPEYKDALISHKQALENYYNMLPFNLNLN